MTTVSLTNILIKSTSKGEEKGSTNSKQNANVCILTFQIINYLLLYVLCFVFSATNKLQIGNKKKTKNKKTVEKSKGTAESIHLLQD